MEWKTVREEDFSMSENRGSALEFGSRVLHFMAVVGKAVIKFKKSSLSIGKDDRSGFKSGEKSSIASMRF